MTFRSSLFSRFDLVSRFGLVAGFGSVALVAACSSPTEDGPSGGPPSGVPGGTPGAGNGGSGQIASGNGGTQGLGGSGNVSQGSGGTAPGLGQGGGVAAGVGGTGNVAAGAGLDIKPDANGFVQGSTNGINVQGAFYTAKDTGRMGAAPGSAIMPATFMAAVGATGEVCVSGTVAQVALAAVQPPATVPPAPPAPPAYDYGNYWGAALGVNLSQPTVNGAPQPTPVPWPVQTPAGKVTGFQFTLSGATIPAAPLGLPGSALRFKTTFAGPTGVESTDQYCLTMSTLTAVGNTYTVLLNQQTKDCWVNGGAPFAATSLLSVQWQVVSNETAAVPFNFCISNLKALIGP